MLTIARRLLALLTDHRWGVGVILGGSSVLSSAALLTISEPPPTSSRAAASGCTRATGTIRMPWRMPRRTTQPYH